MLEATILDEVLPSDLATARPDDLHGGDDAHILWPRLPVDQVLDLARADRGETLRAEGVEGALPHHRLELLGEILLRHLAASVHSPCGTRNGFFTLR